MKTVAAPKKGSSYNASFITLTANKQGYRIGTKVEIRNAI